MFDNIFSKSINLLYLVLYKIKPRYAAELMYRHAFHKSMNLKNPQNLVEKIYWLQYNTDTSLWSLCADKYRMREYVGSKGLSGYLPRLYGHWDNPDDIDFASLPAEFVLKSNNGCGTVRIVRDKSTIDIATTKKTLKKWLKPYGYVGGQTHYLRIKPCIIAEELLHQDGEQSGNYSISLIDYKVWCFNGKPECILVVYNREGSNYLMDMYDITWKRIPNSLKKNKHYGAEGENIPTPVCLEEILEIAKKLSEPFEEVRVDFYVIGNRPVIGELTFTSGYGNYADAFYDYLGSKLELTNKR